MLIKIPRASPHNKQKWQPLGPKSLSITFLERPGTEKPSIATNLIPSVPFMCRRNGVSSWAYSGVARQPRTKITNHKIEIRAQRRVYVFSREKIFPRHFVALSGPRLEPVWRYHYYKVKYFDSLQPAIGLVVNVIPMELSVVCY